MWKYSDGGKLDFAVGYNFLASSQAEELTPVSLRYVSWNFGNPFN